MIVGKDPEGFFSVEGCPLLSVEGCPLLSVEGCPLLSVEGCPLLSVEGCPLLSVEGCCEAPESFLLFEKDTWYVLRGIIPDKTTIETITTANTCLFLDLKRS
jgi:hypothetical protein